MKILTIFKALSSKAKIVSLSIVLFIGFSSFINLDKITICHVPPGNPGNAHEITISLNALQAHLNHGDRICCNNDYEYQTCLRLVNNDKTRIIKHY